MSAVGHTTREAFEAAREACKEHAVELLIVDSYGVALHGDAEHARDVIGFHQEYLEPLRALGIAVLVIDHQSRLQAGQSYQQKGAFGSVYKGNLARSVIQVEATERRGHAHGAAQAKETQLWAACRALQRKAHVL